MNARAIARSAMLALAVAVAVACDGGAEPPARPAGPSPPGASPAAGCPRPGAGTAQARSQLIPAPSNGLPRSTAKGETLVVEAVVLGRDCRPAADAMVRLWHTDAKGLYGPGENRCCYYAGVVRSDDSGRFRLRSVRPAQYPVPDAPPAHVHLEIRHAAGNLDTEIIFAGGPPADRVLPSGHVVPMELSRDGAGWRGAVVFVLPGTG
jgi:protocatechuate 3,4-dioxygenase beta subunit